MRPRVALDPLHYKGTREWREMGSGCDQALGRVGSWKHPDNKKGPTFRSTRYGWWLATALFVVSVLATVPALVHAVHESAAGAGLARRGRGARFTQLARRLGHSRPRGGQRQQRPAQDHDEADHANKRLLDHDAGDDRDDSDQGNQCPERDAAVV